MADVLRHAPTVTGLPWFPADARRLDEVGRRAHPPLVTAQMRRASRSASLLRWWPDCLRAIPARVVAALARPGSGPGAGEVGRRRSTCGAAPMRGWLRVPRASHLSIARPPPGFVIAPYERHPFQAMGSGLVSPPHSGAGGRPERTLLAASWVTQFSLHQWQAWPGPAWEPADRDRSTNSSPPAHCRVLSGRGRPRSAAGPTSH